MKKSIFLIVVLIVLGGVWYGQDALRSYFLSDQNNELNNNPTITEEPANPAEEPTAEAPKSAEELLQERAMEIANRPTYVSAKLAPAVEKSALEKISAAVDLIQSNYDYDIPWLELGGYRKIIGDYEGAIQAWLFLSEIRPNSFVPLHNIGELYAFTLKNPVKGEQYFLGSLEINPSSTQAYLSLASLYATAKELGKADQVDDILLRGISANITDALLMTTLAGYYRDNGQKSLAITYYRKALELFPDDENLKREIAALESGR